MGGWADGQVGSAAAAPTPPAAPTVKAEPDSPLPTNETLAAMTHKDAMRLGADVIGQVAQRLGVTVEGKLAATVKAVREAAGKAVNPVAGKATKPTANVKPAADTKPAAGTLFLQDGKGGFRPATEAEIWAALDAMTAGKKAA